MRNILIVFLLALSVAGCAKKENVLLPTGFYSGGQKFAYCKNPQLFDATFIKFVNENYTSSLNTTVESIAEINAENSNGYSVQTPLKCNGVFSMKDGSYYKFNVKVSIPKQNSPRIDSLTMNEDKEREITEHESFANSFNSPSIQYCEDLMRKVRESYGKAPRCIPVIQKGMNVTESSGVVGLSDELTGKNIYYYMNILPGQLNGDYSYSERELSTLITMIKFQGKGV
ncbi:hypothetical protein [Pantoea stewartii]|uniref:Lipoprotein n=1 Tax=Pantoea stewartii subsp. stewartii DC283 TaxID=660596 RepID=A0ABN4Z0E7_PANSE|nr:hypothetical protein [Pantoea stewartii]ARF49846.1 hypothetical protein DSJ_11140 [Pantoea stewartii subsp. stewartii DC283]KAB0559351.1 hypothetical protein F7Q90_02085 [Pantoea stewartii subsp. stewartii]